MKLERETAEGIREIEGKVYDKASLNHTRLG